MTLNRTNSSLPTELELLIESTIGCCLNVHKELGPGLNEGIYARACCIELRATGLRFEREKAVVIRYRDKLLCHQRIDLLVEQKLIVEVKSVERLHPLHLAQTVGYLRVTGLRAGLLVNFNVPLLRDGIRRVVL